MSVTKKAIAKSDRQPIQNLSSAIKSLIYTLNGRWHRRAMQVFMLVILAHLLEHFFQAYQVYVMGWSRPDALGALGFIYPWLVRSEWLHYGHALFMLVGLAVLRPAIVGEARNWWNIAFVLQFWHHFEHALLLGQVLIHKNLFDSSVPTSVLQLWIPRLEVHLFYNTVVLIPMLIALYYHRFPPAQRA
ncbi:hypothetical protein WA1_00820 [Scytonema hofmannii PCC 7110]|uniref:Uncharacterized protein n=1 Tax=Scytonema hofmannii PCC 7110 TaxID=128403 RepID=A0A139XGD5_9CYAN|nr:hypothetical protein [Scytonema hofmannii]KYC43739.1 hypothetical protein WA1_00820 [Scytonema hofmannii PCC 7110]